MRYYGKNFAPKIKELIQLANAGQSPSEKLTLSEEVAIVRAVTNPQLDRFMDMVFDESLPHEQRLGASELVKKCMADVSAIVEKASKVRALSTDAATVEDIDYVIGQVVGAIQQVVEPVDPILSATLQERIANIKLPGRNRDLPEPAKLLHKAIEEITKIQLGAS